MGRPRPASSGCTRWRTPAVELPGFDLAGVNDVAGESEGQGPDFARALGDRDRTRAAVLLAHQPVVIHDAVKHGVDLQLSGHTHGGQLWPGNYLAELANPTVAGLDATATPSSTSPGAPAPGARRSGSARPPTSPSWNSPRTGPDPTQHPFPSREAVTGAQHLSTAPAPGASGNSTGRRASTGCHGPGRPDW